MHLDLWPGWSNQMQALQSCMIGQTLPGRYRYSVAEGRSQAPKHDRCDSLTFKPTSSKARLIEEIADMLSRPGVILRELTRLGEESGNEAEQASVGKVKICARRPCPGLDVIPGT
jgi:hypothetical protein